MSFTVAIKQTAHDDIQRNTVWWAEHHSLDQAILWKDAIYEQIEALSEMPLRHALAPENDQFSYEIREKPIGLGNRPSYRAIFTIVENEVHVLSVRRVSQDEIRPSDFPT